MTTPEYKLLYYFTRHCERILTRIRPDSSDTVTYNAYRLALNKELPKIKRLLQKYQNELNHD